MCGIAGYIGNKNAPELLFDMLGRLEYRGYDSAGIACISEKSTVIFKDKGKVCEVIDRISTDSISADIGIAHTRWATHGVPSKKNAHPHKDSTGRFAVVHNGIIENHTDLREELAAQGYSFDSDTDTEVIPHLINAHFSGDFEEAFVSALKKLRGSFAVAAVFCDDPDRILVARKDSPLIVGLGEGETFLASDTPALLPYTRRVIILNDFNYAILSRKGVTVKDLKNLEVIRAEPQEINWDITQAEKKGYPSFMLKEIFEEPESVENALKALSEIKRIAGKLKEYKRVYFLGCGTASYAGMVGKYALERFGIPSELVVGSEFRYSTINTIDDTCAVIAISQSGETADTLASVREAKRRGAYIASIVNVVGSTLTQASDDVIATYSGPEIAVASTKAYVGQVTSILLLCVYFAKEWGKISEDYVCELLDDLKSLPEKIRQILSESDKIEEFAKSLAGNNMFFYIGRRLNYPTALEGALKLKEISYVHAEAYPAGELKHGPLALLETGVPVIALKSNDELVEKLESNISEAKSRGASVFVVGESGDLRMPMADPLLSPLLYIVPLHLFAYYVSIEKGLDPDKPRNLAKSVTVE